MYTISEISNRDLALLYEYRILRQPADFLSKIFTDSSPYLTEIYDGQDTELFTEVDENIYAYSLNISVRPGYIPYLEFDCASSSDAQKLASLLYLEDGIIYGTVSTFQNPVRVKVYWVKSLEDIQTALNAFLDALAQLDVAALQKLIEEQKSRLKPHEDIKGNNDNLVQLIAANGGVAMTDSDYKITTALEAQLLVNPTQELLMSLPRRLRHNINIAVTDGKTRHLSGYTGYSISIRGNGNWVLRDIHSGINFVSGEGTVYLWDCALVHFRNTVGTESNAGDGYHCTYLHAHRSLIVLNQGTVKSVCLDGGSTMMAVPSYLTASRSSFRLESISYVGPGSSLYCWSDAVSIDVSQIVGMVWWCDAISHATALYIGCKRIDVVGGQHDAELQPSQILDFDVDNIHIHLGGE